MSVIYNIKNLSNGKIYIGSTKHFTVRKNAHFRNLLKNKHPNKHLQSAFNISPESFIMEIVEKVESKNYQMLLEREQYHIDHSDHSMLYNKAFDVTGGGYEVNMIEVHLLNLKGVIMHTFKSIQDASKFLNPTSRQSIFNKTINTNRISKHHDGLKYRVVTPDFYDNNINIIKNWKPYSCKAAYKSNFISNFVMYNDDENITFKTKRACANKLGVTCERIRQLIINNDLHKKSGFYIKQIVIDKNVY